MAIQTREVKNKRNADDTLSGKPGPVYDVIIHYRAIDGTKKAYHKKGFLTQKEAKQHEAQMRQKLLNPGFRPLSAKEEKLLLGEYMLEWLNSYAKVNVRSATFQGYRTNITKHVNPHIGNIRLVNLTARDLDQLYTKLREENLAVNTVKYVHRTLSVALEHAMKHGHIPINPARNVTTRFSGTVSTPPPFMLDQTRRLIEGCRHTEWEMPIVLAALYGLRRGEVLGITLDDVDLKNNLLVINKQKAHVSDAADFAPVKEAASNRRLPITDETKPFFTRRLREIERQKREQGSGYHDKRLFVCKADGEAYAESHISRRFGSFLCHLDLPRIRFHDLRHTAATNMHELTGDFYTVAAILGHSLKGIGQSLNIGSVGRNATERYINVRDNGKYAVLSAYHVAVLRDEEEKKRPRMLRL